MRSEDNLWKSALFFSRRDSSNSVIKLGDMLAEVSHHHISNLLRDCHLQSSPLESCDSVTKAGEQKFSAKLHS